MWWSLTCCGQSPSISTGAAGEGSIFAETDHGPLPESRVATSISTGSSLTELTASAMRQVKALLRYSNARGRGFQPAAGVTIIATLAASSLLNRTDTVAEPIRIAMD